MNVPKTTTPIAEQLYEVEKTKSFKNVKQLPQAAGAALDTNNNQNGVKKINADGSFCIEAYMDDEEWLINSSDFADQTSNPVRKMIEQMKIEPNPQLPMIALSIGDPTISSHLARPDTVVTAVTRCLADKRFDGYTPSYGTETARAAVAKYSSRPHSQLVYKPADIFLTNGCSQALDLCITALANRGDNILVPRPGFSIYKTLGGTLGIHTKSYDLQADNNWEIDLVHMESLIDENTTGILVNNPSNPCGSVYSDEHLREILRVAEKYKLPIIADEVYGDMVFPGNSFTYISELSHTVPVLHCSALSKRFILPGWRFGWIAVHDPKNHLHKIRNAFANLTTRILGPNSLVQGALPEILESTPQSYFDETMRLLSENADIVHERLSKMPGLKPRKAAGAMYLMVEIKLSCFPGIKNDMDFVQSLIREQSVFCLPASIFESPNFFRIVITMHKEKISEACSRIEAFVHAHYVKA